MDDYISHFGIPRRSGRYPWGSGKNPYQGDGKKHKISEKDKKRKKIRLKNTKLSEAKKDYNEKTKNCKDKLASKRLGFFMTQIFQQQMLQQHINEQQLQASQNAINIANSQALSAAHFAAIQTPTFF